MAVFHLSSIPQPDKILHCHRCPVLNAPKPAPLLYRKRSDNVDLPSPDALKCQIIWLFDRFSQPTCQRTETGSDIGNVTWQHGPFKRCNYQNILHYIA